MANLAIELHDSTLDAIRRVGTDSVLVMRVFVHSSEGRPGRERGTGWYQDAEVTVRDADVNENPPEAFRVMDGTVQIDDQVIPNVFDLPCDRHGTVTLTLSGTAGTLHARGRGIRVQLLGEPGEVERFSPR